ncbi:MAG: hypothetical protein E6249_02250 [Peptoniphilus grossensis]|uniref:hypothetical protein n=1 Tax=Peptoniphilus grossensis TaxID=1465756 RepID=UPI002584CDCB|nr:hypothetical protein [Peptoniphilus grossensis]MDU5099268.1 hypothetical protein [Peptoniphilus grossensis]
MKLKRTIAVALKKNEKIQVPNGELWVGYTDRSIIVEIVGANSARTNHWGYGFDLANATAGSSSNPNIDVGRTKRFYATPGSQVIVKVNTSIDATYAFTCLVFDISKEVSNV